MIWVFVIGGIAVAGLIMLVGYAIWLAHKASDVYAELKVLGKRADRLMEITSRIEVPELTSGSTQDPERPSATESVKQTRMRPPVATARRQKT